MLWMRMEGFDLWRESFSSHNAHPVVSRAPPPPPVHGQSLLSQELARSPTQHQQRSSATAMSMADFHKKYNALADYTMEIVQLSQGVPEAFVGDSLLASWNALKPCRHGEHQALTAAYQLNTNPTLRSIAELRATVAVVHGKAKVGIVGDDRTKRPVVMSRIIEECMQLAAHCRFLEVGSLVEWTPEVQSSLSDHFVFRIVGVGKFYRRSRTTTRILENAHGDATGRESLPATPGAQPPPDRIHTAAVPPAPHVALVAELLGPTTLTQWQYELKGHREFIDTYNTVVRTVFDGRLNDARAIPLPRGMPRWLQQDLAHVTLGRLKTIEVWS